ncbi:MAG: PAS domain-containing protein, partial [Pseudomonadota bacterium]
MAGADRQTPRRPPPPNLLLGYGAALLVVAAAALLTLRAAGDFATSSREVLHTQLVLETVSSVQVGYANMVAAVRAHIITMQDRYELERQDAAADMKAALATLLILTADNAEQQSDLHLLRDELVRREAVLARALELRAEGGIDAVLTLTGSADVNAAVLRIEDLFDRVQRRERELLVKRSQLDDKRIVVLRRTLFAFFACTLVILGILLLRARDNFRRREVARRELEWQRGFADAIIDNAPLGLYLKDARELKLMRVNKVVEELMGVSRNELLGKDDRSFYPPEIAEQHLAEEFALLARGDRLTVQELIVQTPHGRRVLHVRKVPLFDDDGKADFLLGLFEDVTEQRDAEAQLQQKTRELESANKELESFSYSVSHDLRAPLRAVDGYAAMLQEDCAASLNDEGRRYLVAIREGARRMGELIQDLLGFSRLGRQPIEPVETATLVLVNAAWEVIRQSQPSLRASLTVGELPASYGDPRLLLQIWTNLLDNAVKYSAKSATPAVDVRGEIQGDEAVFSISDNGVGFDMRYYDKLFNVFQRL